MQQKERRQRFRWIREFWSLVRPFWTSEEKWIAFAQLFTIVAISLAIVYLSVQLNTWYQQFYDIAGVSTAASTYYKFILKYCWIAGIWVSIGWVSSYLGYRLRLRWREWMTRRMVSLWLLDQKHYYWSLSQKHIDNPEQRLTEDVQIFIQLTLSLSLGILNNIVNLISFLGILWGLSGVLSIPLGGLTLSIPGYLVLVSILYASASNWLVFLVGRKLAPLQSMQQHREADFRFSLSKIRENSEEIALAKGESAEIQGTLDLFSRAVKNYRAMIRKFIEIEMFGSIHGQIRAIFPFFMAGPRLLSGAIKVGGLFQITNAFEKVESSISFLVSSFNSIAEWRAALKRLADFEESLKRANAVREKNLKKLIEVTSGSSLVAKNLELLTPEGRHLVDQLCLEIRQGERILFEGASGTGKSSLFRAFAGIWPFFNGSLQVPGADSCVFVSQSPYLPQGTLRQALLYPKYSQEVSNDDLEKHLIHFGLGHLQGKLLIEENWEHILSPGEKQRIVMIRALIRKPKWLFLDEATASLDQNNQFRIYEKICKNLPETTLVSIGHRESIANFHERTLNLNVQSQVRQGEPVA